jgi:nitrogen regulatory protein P-II 1
MDLALVVAIIRTTALGAAEKKLHEIGVRGITIIKAQGFGEQSLDHDILGRALMANQAKIEIYASSDQAERIATTLIEAAHTGSAGDGIVAILPVQRVFSVRTRSDTIPNRARDERPTGEPSSTWRRP